MEGSSLKCSEPINEFDDPDFFQNIVSNIEKELANMKKIVNNIVQMTVDAAYLQSDLIMIIDAPTWENISELIGLSSVNISIEDDMDP